MIMDDISQGYGSQLNLCTTMTDGVWHTQCGIHNRVTCRSQTQHIKQAGDMLPLASYGELPNFQTVDGLDT